MLGAGHNPGKEFQSTFPARGTTKALGLMHKQVVISIHVPREGNDLCS